ncbi:hypothetical protein LTR70_009157 [Exophiala xenobiotica]|uniref:EamA domain-containing protein n=1 Tax=Lithohypha guttulata TaxID=1690604 RepID=A0ABR0JYS5_9EURO|nr:hypothetical protein LTR24_008876 [Lithohypha guttulata]KAK5310905.1 hypothetical protein LTR70_009157 [Exophiala xenobiotica]
MSDEKSQSSHDISSVSTVVPSASSSNSKIETLKSPNTFLTVPSHYPTQRGSIDSAFSGSDISELSFGSTEFGSSHDEGLIKTLSNVSATFANFPSPPRWRIRALELWDANYGAFLVLVSQMFGCVMNIATRLLEIPGTHGEPMHPFQILFARQSITVLITTSYALWSKSVPHFPLGPPGRVRLLLVARGLFGFLGVFGLYFSLLYLSISEATILTFLVPIGSCYAFSLLIPGETFSKQQQMAGFISLLGVILIARPVSLFSGGGHEESMPNPEMSLPANSTMTRPEVDGAPQPSSSQHLHAVGIAMIGVVGGIGAMTSIRSIGTRAHALLSVNYFSAWCTFVSLMALLVLPSVEFRLPGNIMEWGLLSILGCCGFSMQLLLTKGMAYGTPGSSMKQAANPSEDVEMQARTVGPHASVSTARSNVASNCDSRIITKPIKGSGAKATSMLYTQMLFALIADKIIFDVTPGAWSWAGSGFILFGAIWVAADGGKKSASSEPAAAAPQHEQEVSAQKSVEDVSHEEEVGLLADVDDTASAREDAEDQTQRDLRPTGAAHS